MDIYSKGNRCVVCSKIIVNKATHCRKHVPRTKEWRERMSKPRKPFSQETRLKMSLAKKGKSLLGENNSWKGDDCGYFGKHVLVKRHRGNPKKCEHCGKVGEKVNGRWNIEWANISKKYYRDVNDYKGLCKKCHYRFDGQRIVKRDNKGRILSKVV